MIQLALDAGHAPVAFLMERKHVQGQAQSLLARCGDIPVYTADRDVLAALTGYPLTRGILCAIRRPQLPAMEDICQGGPPGRGAGRHCGHHQCGRHFPFRRRPAHGRRASLSHLL